MNILITGGSGFIGQHAEALLKARGHGVTVFDQKMLLDVFDAEAIEEAVACNEVVLHLIGQANMHRAQLEPQESFRLNVEALNCVLEACRKAGGRRIVLPSSAAVYGLTRVLPVNEATPPNPSQVYAYHKLIEEELVKAYRENYGVEYVILRLFNVYGKGSRNVVATMIEKALKEEKFTAYGGRQLRDWVYVEDVARAMALAVSCDAVKNRVVNIGTGEGVRVERIAEVVKELYGLEYEFQKTPAEFKEYDSVADVSVARYMMKWEPEIVGIEKMREVIRGGI